MEAGGTGEARAAAAKAVEARGEVRAAEVTAKAMVVAVGRATAVAVGRARVVAARARETRQKRPRGPPGRPAACSRGLCPP